MPTVPASIPTSLKLPSALKLQLEEDAQQMGMSLHAFMVSTLADAAQRKRLRQSFAQDAADALYLRFVQGYSTHVARLDPDMFENGKSAAEALKDSLRHYEREMEEPFPEDPAKQLSEVLRSMSRAWEGTSARLLRQAKGAPARAYAFISRLNVFLNFSTFGAATARQ